MDDPILLTLVEKLANAAIGGLTRGFLGEDRAIQLEAVLATKVEEAKEARKRTKLTDAKAITGEALLKLHRERQAQQSTPKTPRKRRTGPPKTVSFKHLPRSSRSTTTTYISISSSPSLSESGPSFQASDSEFESIHSGSEGSTIYVRTPGT